MAISKKLMEQYNAQADEAIEETHREVEKLMDFEGIVDLGKTADQMKETEEQKKRDIHDIPVDELDPHPQNHFPGRTGEEWSLYVNAVRMNGITEPLIVRTKRVPGGYRYEVLSGHDRRRAAIEIGLKSVPCIIRELSDEDALDLIGLANRHRDDIPARVWGFAYRESLEAVKHQGRRSGKGRVDTLVSTVDTSSDAAKSVDNIASKYGVGSGTVKRRIRLTYLSEELYEACESAGLKQSVEVALSYLTEDNQAAVAQLIYESKLMIDDDIAGRMREASDSGLVFTPDVICDLLETVEKNIEADVPEQPRAKSFKVYDETLFPAKYRKKREREEYIYKLLCYARDNNIEL